MIKKVVQPTRTPTPQAYRSMWAVPLGARVQMNLRVPAVASHVEGLSDARTQMVAFFSIL